MPEQRCAISAENRFIRFAGRPFALALLVSAVLAAYANTLRHGFVWDDYGVIVNNGYIRDWKNVLLLFSKSYFPSFGELTYRPVVTASYFIDYSLWGLNPFGYHFGNVLLHAANSSIFFVWAGFVLKRKDLALFAAVLFALHPVQSEAVSVVAFREDLLAFMFYFMAFILYIQSVREEGAARKKVGFYFLSLAAFALAVFSKEMAITLPFGIVLYDVCMSHGKGMQVLMARFWPRYAGYILLLAAYGVITFGIMRAPAAVPVGYAGGNWHANVLTMVRVYASYIGLVLAPIHAHHILHGNSLVSYSLFEPKVILSLCVVLACIAGVLKAGKTIPVISFSILLFFIALLPVSNIIPLNNFMANRYLYTPLAGFCLFIAYGVCRVCKRGFSPFPHAVVGSIVKCMVVSIPLVYLALTSSRNNSWRNDESFWSEMCRVYPDSFEAHNQLAAAFFNKKAYAKAIPEYLIAVNLSPPSVAADSRFYLGICYYALEKHDEAIAWLRSAAQRGCQQPLLPKYLGMAVQKKGLDIQARENVEKKNPVQQ